MVKIIQSKKGANPMKRKEALRLKIDADQGALTIGTEDGSFTMPFNFLEVMIIASSKYYKQYIQGEEKDD